jgi:hypothetical protein
MKENENMIFNMYPNISFVRALVNDDNGEQRIAVAMSTHVRLKDDMNKGTMITMGIFYDTELTPEEYYPIEMTLSDEFHKNVKKVYEEGISALKPDTPIFDVDDPEL